MLGLEKLKELMIMRVLFLAASMFLSTMVFGYAEAQTEESSYRPARMQEGPDVWFTGIAVNRVVAHRNEDGKLVLNVEHQKRLIPNDYSEIKRKSWIKISGVEYAVPEDATAPVKREYLGTLVRANFDN